MRFPSQKQYTAALLEPTSYFIPEIVRNSAIELVPGSNRPNIIPAGQSFVVKITDQNGKYWALKLFKGELDQSKFNDVKARYDALSSIIEPINYSCFAKSHFFSRGIKVDGVEYPILIMEWVSGTRLDVEIKQLISSRSYPKLNLLADKLAALALQLKQLQIAHGDIHFKNIIVNPAGNLVLLDYDDIWVKGKIERNATVWGNPEFQHPLRETAPIHGAGVDNFSFWISIISIYLIIYDPQSWDLIDKDGCSDERILFGASDFKEPDRSIVFGRLQGSERQEIHNWLAVILNDLISITRLTQIPCPDHNTQILYNKYASAGWEPNKFTIYDPKKRCFIKKN